VRQRIRRKSAENYGVYRVTAVARHPVQQVQLRPCSTDSLIPIYGRAAKKVCVAAIASAAAAESRPVRWPAKMCGARGESNPWSAPG